MKNIFLILFILPHLSYALTLQVVGACSEKPTYDVEIDIQSNIDVGSFTLNSFNLYGIPYVGNNIALNSILNFPVGLEALEVLSDTSMRAHGPCFMVDGVISESFPSDIILSDKTKVLKWFIGYSTLVGRDWIGQCEPTAEISPSQFCK